MHYGGELIHYAFHSLCMFYLWEEYIIRSILNLCTFLSQILAQSHHPHQLISPLPFPWVFKKTLIEIIFKVENYHLVC